MQPIKDVGVAGKFNFAVSSPAYLAPTENLKDTVEVVNDKHIIRGKKVLTICGSGDTIIGYCLNGASSVLAVDISSFGSRWGELKSKAWYALGYKRLLKFIDIIKSGILTPEFFDMYSLVRKFLSKECLELFNEVFNRSPIPSNLFKKYEGKDRYLESYLPYDENSRKVNIIKKSRSINIPMDHLLSKIESEFDIIHCANLLQYVYKGKLGSDGEAAAREEKLKWLRLLKTKIRRKGVIVDYSYSFNLHLHETFMMIAAEAGLNCEIVPVNDMKGGKDHVLLYTHLAKKTAVPEMLERLVFRKRDEESGLLIELEKLDRELADQIRKYHKYFDSHKSKLEAVRLFSSHWSNSKLKVLKAEIEKVKEYINLEEKILSKEEVESRKEIELINRAIEKANGKTEQELLEVRKELLELLQVIEQLKAILITTRMVQNK